MDELIVSEDGWPYGLRCMDCGTSMKEGTAYSKRLVGVASCAADEADSSDCGYPIVEIVCVPCGLGLTYGR
jgi:hypothetical protein